MGLRPAQPIDPFNLGEDVSSFGGLAVRKATFYACDQHPAQVARYSWENLSYVAI